MDWSKYQAALFDLDGVLTPTTDLHMKAWSEMFNQYLQSVGHQQPYTEADYFAHVDGKPRYDGVRSFLKSRGFEPSEAEVVELGDRKNQTFTDLLERDGIQPYPGSLQLIEQLRAQNMVMCVVSSSRNAESVLAAAQIRDFFAHVVDGNVARELGLAGKPAPDTYSYAAKLAGFDNAGCVVLEDAISGVQAGAAGGFGLVIGVDRGAGRTGLEAGGADQVVTDLQELLP